MASENRFYLDINLNRHEVKNIIIDNDLEENYAAVWDNNTLYFINQKIYYTISKKFYICTIEHTSSNDFNDDLANWNELTSLDLKTNLSLNNKGLIYFDTSINRLRNWNGYFFKTLLNLEDLNIPSNESVQLDNIWIDTYNIPLNQGDADISIILHKHIDIPTVFVDNYTFKVDVLSYNQQAENTHINNQPRLAIKNIVPINYGNGDLYKPIVKTSNGIIIDNNWKLVDDSIVFYNGFQFDNSLNISENNPPIVTFYEYIGRRMSLDILTGGEIYRINASYGESINNIFTIPIIGNIYTTSQIKQITINGIIIFSGYNIISMNLLEIDTDVIGYTIDDDDMIYIHT